MPLLVHGPQLLFPPLPLVLLLIHLPLTAGQCAATATMDIVVTQLDYPNIRLRSVRSALTLLLHLLCRQFN